MAEFDSPDEELVAATPSQKNWAGIAISLFVICAVCGLILFSIYLLRPPDDGPRVKGRKIFLNDTTSKHFTAPPFNGTWISENELLFQDYLGGLSVLNVETLVSRTFVAYIRFRQLVIHKFAVSPDRQFILFIHDAKLFWEHSYSAKCTVYDIKNDIQFPLSPFEETSREAEQPEFQHVEWGPHGNALVFVYQNDIYYKAEARSSRVLRITRTGKPEVIFNGTPDWLYEAEIFKSNKATWMSPNGETLVYASFDDTAVGEASYPWYGEKQPYPPLRKFKYPKAGTNNPEVSLWAVNLNSSSLQSVPLQPPTDWFESVKEYYITGVQWVNGSVLTVVWVNRDQNSSVISTCSAQTNWKCQVIYTIQVKPPGSGWLDMPHPPIFSTNLTSCLLRIPRRDGEAGYFHHIVWFDVTTYKEIPITHGPFEVIEVSAWDQSNHFIYFIGVPPGKPGERHLYRTTEKSSNSTSVTAPVCLTCTDPTSKEETSLQRARDDELDALLHYDLQSQNGSKSGPRTTTTSTTTTSTTTSSPIYPNSSASFQLGRKAQRRGAKSACLFNKVIFSPNTRFFVRECLGPGFPTATLHLAPSGRLAFVLNNNTGLQQEVADLGLPLVKNFFVEVTGGYHAPVRLFLPPGFRENEEFKFPFVLHTAGGPGSQLVSEKWRLSWVSYLTSQKNYIVAEVDARGTGFQGDTIRHSVYKKLGTVAITDQLEVVKYLKDNLAFIDADNTAVYGHGYGGYTALLTLAADTTNMLKCGIAVSPITKWEFYNTFYTERYMGRPNFPENMDGYQDADVTRVVKKLKDRKFLIIHGTADERVQYQHTLHLTKALINESIRFTEQIYPDENHELSGVVEHLYSTMEAYFDRMFGVIDWEDWEKANFLGIKM